MSEYKLTLLYKKGLDYKTRNSISLLVMLILIIVSSVLIQRKLAVNHTDFQKENTALNSQLQNIVQQMSYSKQAEERLKELQEELFLTNKVLPNSNTPTITLAHIFNIFRKYQNYFPFDFRHLSSGKVEKDQQVLFNRYTITGRTYANLLYSFLDQFERQLAFYTIEDIDLSALPPDEEGKVGFIITFNAYYTASGTSPKDIVLKNLKKRELPYNIFYPRIFVTYDRSDEQDYPDAADLTIVGITPDQAFLRNNRTGIVSSFEKGSRVKFGKVHRIDWDKQEIVFRLNRTGLTEEYRLEVVPKK